MGIILYFCKKNNSVRVIAKKILRDFWESHSDSEQQLKSWYQEAENGSWSNLNELKNEYPNSYRFIVKVNFNYQMMWIRFIGTHAEYDKIDANKI